MFFLALYFLRPERGTFRRFRAARRFTRGGVESDAAMRRIKRRMVTSKQMEIKIDGEKTYAPVQDQILKRVFLNAGKPYSTEPVWSILIALFALAVENAPKVRRLALARDPHSLI
ncbi:MAG: hypothetical protein NTY00_10695 [Deltaproteobacteria bacterium]|nr:hypothetical protein [Deltaproteobacteria bacterium]